MGKLTISTGPLSMAMWNYQKVFPIHNPIQPPFSYGFPMVFRTFSERFPNVFRTFSERFPIVPMGRLWESRSHSRQVPPRRAALQAPHWLSQHLAPEPDELRARMAGRASLQPNWHIPKTMCISVHIYVCRYIYIYTEIYEDIRCRQ